MDIPIDLSTIISVQNTDWIVTSVEQRHTTDGEGTQLAYTIWLREWTGAQEKILYLCIRQNV